MIRNEKTLITTGNDGCLQIEKGEFTITCCFGVAATTAIGLDVGVSSATTSIGLDVGVSSTTSINGLDVGVSVVRGKHAAFSPTGASSQHSAT